MTFYQSLRCAAAGICHALRTQAHMRFHLAACLAVVATALSLRLPAAEVAILLLAISSVMAAEALNTAVEVLADRITTQQDEAIRIAKDVAAGAVLLTALCASIIGLLILGPPLWACVTKQ